MPMDLNVSRSPDTMCMICVYVYVHPHNQASTMYTIRKPHRTVEVDHQEPTMHL